ncbi:glycosyltransferase family 2 protein [Aquibium carbonis]|uniref:Glycosyltransferase family 2 protein n=1 Tax=Aquibium carbonis TaxID=2495581 RepID=A0A3R9YD20_9HYPH|nr:glycosyltransferase family 2 protein [Aquibium carbonis]RST88450.1 glycosyltransferase family 2 protein [Aquibium carbonis]
MLSAYVLTRNSERLLEKVLRPLLAVADEVLVLDSGSTDRTLDIARGLGCRIEQSTFEGYGAQRQKAQWLCSHDHVLFVDSDEIMSEALVEAVRSLKASGFPEDAYAFRREWIVLGRPVRAFYPVKSPDFPIRLLNRTRSSFASARVIHERPSGQRSVAVLDGPLFHDTFHSPEEFSRKLDSYSRFGGQDLLERGRSAKPAPVAAVGALIAFVRWYVATGSWRDGKVGLMAGVFACRYTYRKHVHARRLARGTDQSGPVEPTPEPVVPRRPAGLDSRTG